MWLRGGHRGERGQALFVVVGAMSVVFVIGAIAVDVGLWLADRRSVQSAADLAALAGSQDLPGDEAAAVASACEWAANNGYVDGANGVGVSVLLLDLDDPAGGVGSPCVGGGAAGGACGGGCDAIRVTISKPGSMLFTSIVGVETEVTASASAVAGVNVDLAPKETLLLFDSSGDMLIDCNSTRSNTGCGIKEAKDAAANFVEALTGGTSGGVAVGFLPYNYCYGVVSPDPGQCVREEWIVPPTTDAGPLLEAIDAVRALSYVNICTPLARAPSLLGEGPAPPTVVLLSRGDNLAYHNPSWRGVPPSCRPESANEVILEERPCRPPTVEERQIDVRAWQEAEELKALGAEVYVVGLQVCGSDDGMSASDAGYCAGIGDEAHDAIADQRLLKCIASSDEHFVRVATPEGLTAAFADLALEMAERGLLE